MGWMMVGKLAGWTTLDTCFLIFSGIMMCWGGCIMLYCKRKGWL